ncbi:hypothetical protein BDFB_013051 [Asbolus verrucosus]|nr:hypothetical protein BDFB_013051 [Asbolus verrucosus]
MVCGST